MSIRELRASLSSIDEIVERDGDVLLTRNGQPVVMMVSLNPRRTAPSHAELRVAMPYMRVPSEDFIRADRERG